MPWPRAEAVGMKFGEWTVMSYEGGSRWRCKCSCGTVALKLLAKLTSGHSKSCGCQTTAMIGDAVSKELVGKRFGRLLVVEKASRNRRGSWLWRAQCDCGGEAITETQNLTSGNTQSCGCLQIERTTKHGMHGTPTYVVWNGMKNRCLQRGQGSFQHYGGRGIGFDPRWAHFENFFADMGVRPEGYSLERKDTNKGYSKDNCVWIPRSQQNKNTRRTRVVDINGQEMVLEDAIKMLKKTARWKYAQG